MSNRNKKADRVVVVTGASAGVGRAIAREFARQGAKIGLLARGRDRLDATAEEVESAGARALVLPTDVADAEAVERAAEKVERLLGPIDVWINNAMVTVFGPFRELSAAEFRRVTEVTYLGSVHGTMSALWRMRLRNAGKIVQVGSALSYRSIPLQSAYCGAKHGINGFLDSLRTELEHEGSAISVTNVHLPGMNTPQFTWGRSKLPWKAQPMAPIFQPEVAARAVYWAADHHRREIDVGASAFWAIQANKIVPGLADRYLARNGWDGQLRHELEDVGRKDNLWRTVPGRDHGAHGPFDSVAKEKSYAMSFTKHRNKLLTGGMTLGAVALGLSKKRDWLAKLSGGFSLRKPQGDETARRGEAGREVETRRSV